MDKNTWIKLRCYLMLNARKRTAYLIRKKVFKSVGEDFVFFPRKIPQDPQFIIFHNNVVVATDVMFINHDIIHEMFNGMNNCIAYKKNFDCIEIMDNTFLGARSIILPGVTLGPNVIVAAGSVVTKDFSNGVIVGGNPAKVIGNVEELMHKRLLKSKEKQEKMTKTEEADYAWSLW